MNIHEYQAKALFRNAGIPTPEGRVAATPDEASKIAGQLGNSVAVKAQVHVGGRGKAGGIAIAASPDEAADAAGRILGMNIKGITVRKVLVERGSNITKETYLGLVVDRGTKSVSFIASAEGGVEIEVIAEEHPEKILRAQSIDGVFPEVEARAIAEALFMDPRTVEPVFDIMRKLFGLFVEKDCSLVEINPLVFTRSGEVLALDGKINFDDNSLFKHDDVLALRDMDEENPYEIEAKEKGLSYIELDGNIGCMVNGAGLAMATLDMITLYGGVPANFLDVGGSSNSEKVVDAFRLILRKGTLKVVMINIFGGITRCDDIARGILQAFEEIDIPIPVVVRLSGTNEVEGRGLLEGSPLLPAESFPAAIQKAVAIAGGVAP